MAREMDEAAAEMLLLSSPSAELFAFVFRHDYG
jgi:hypothetical protein